MQNRRVAPPSRGPGPPPREFVLSPDYLRAGYFDNRGNPRPELITSEADQVAEDFYRSKVAYGQVRKFFAKAKFIEQQLASGQQFADQVWRIVSLDRDAADAVGRGTAPPVFKVFIERNVALAKRDGNSFRRGFMPHFESVMAYFRYRRPRD